MAAVILPTNEENTMSAKMIVETAKSRSIGFSGVTSMEAGVNWVRDHVYAAQS